MAIMGALRTMRENHEPACVALRRSGRFGRSVTSSTVWGSGIRNCFTTLSWLRHGEREVGAE